MALLGSVAASAGERCARGPVSSLILEQARVSYTTTVALVQQGLETSFAESATRNFEEQRQAGSLKPADVANLHVLFALGTLRDRNTNIAAEANRVLTAAYERYSAVYAEHTVSCDRFR